jgi:Xaa-Pro aminopeptidase
MAIQADRSNDVLGARQERALARVKELRLVSLLVTNPHNIYYLTGFRGTAGVLLLGAEESRLWVDPRYTLQAQIEAKGVEVIEERHRIFKAAAAFLRKSKPARMGKAAMVGFEEGHLTWAAFEELTRETRRKVRLKPAGSLIEELRSIKDSGEIEHIRRASEISCEAFEQIRDLTKPGVSEAELANELEYRMRHKGAEGPAFDTIVASGPRGAWPHARPSAKPLEMGELVIFDFGAIVAGYAADVTRTVFVGRPDKRAMSLYKAVLGAQQAALEALRAGAQCSEPDRAARRFLSRLRPASTGRLDRFFTHSTGHGVGLDVHERPRLAKGEKTKLAVGQVVTVEPGIYIENLGGIRIEDTVLIGKHGPEVLTPASKEDWVVGWE